MQEFGGADRPAVSRHWTPPWPLDLRATLAPLQHGPADPTVHLVPDGAWRALRVVSPDGEAEAATVRLSIVPGSLRAATRERDPHDARLGGTTRGRLVDPSLGDTIRIDAWGPGAPAAAAQAPAWMGALDDWSGFEDPRFQRSLPDSVTATRRVRPGLRLPSGGALLETLAAVILEQRVTGLEAHYAWTRLVTRFGDAAPGPTPSTTTRAGRETVLRLAPTGAQWRAIPSWEWHAARVDAQRRNTITAVARRESAWRRLEAQGVRLEELDRALTSIPGVGVWTAAETLQRTHGAPDHVSFGDFHVAHFVGQALIGRRVDDEGMERLLAPWTGHRQRVVRLLYASGAKNPSYGPRLAPQDHRRH